MVRIETERLILRDHVVEDLEPYVGWSPRAMTLRYAHLAPEHKAAAVEVLVSRVRDGEAAYAHFEGTVPG